MMCNVFILILGVFFTTSELYAKTCQITPEIFHGYNKPSSFKTLNNLIRYPEQLFSARGKVIYITGQVTDRNCVPVSGAIVRIWHTNHYGKYQYDTSEINYVDNYDPYFLGSGTSVTDNLGNYSFITIFPGADESSAIYINFLVQHRNFLDFESKMFFGLDYSSELKDFSVDLASLLIAEYDGKVYHFDITLGGINPYQTY